MQLARLEIGPAGHFYTIIVTKKAAQRFTITTFETIAGEKSEVKELERPNVSQAFGDAHRLAIENMGDTVEWVVATEAGEASNAAQAAAIRERREG